MPKKHAVLTHNPFTLKAWEAHETCTSAFPNPVLSFSFDWHTERRLMMQCCVLNLLSVRCTALLLGTLEEGQGEGSLDLDCVACSFHLHQVWKYPRRAALGSLVVWQFQSPDLSANIRPVPVQLKGMASYTVNTSWSPYAFLGRCTIGHVEP